MNIIIVSMVFIMLLSGTIPAATSRIYMTDKPGCRRKTFNKQKGRDQVLWGKHKLYLTKF